MAEIVSCPVCSRPRALGYRCPSCGDRAFAQPAETGVGEVAGTFRPEAASWNARPPGQSPAMHVPVTVGPSGIGGWLVLPVLGLFATALLIAIRTVTDTIPVFRTGAWDMFTSPGTALYHPLWQPLLTLEYAADAVMLVGSVVLLVLMAKKKPFLPALMVWFYGFCFLALLVDSLVVLRFGAEMAPDAGLREAVGLTTGDILGDLGRAALVYAIWIPYFLMSKRVKNTFAKVAPPERAWPSPGARWA